MEHVGKVRSIVCFVVFHKNIKKKCKSFIEPPDYDYTSEIFVTSILAVRDFTSFADQATPGFELEKKGICSPRLTTPPCRQNDTTTFLLYEF